MKLRMKSIHDYLNIPIGFMKLHELYPIKCEQEK